MCDVGYALTTGAGRARPVVPDARCGIAWVQGRLWWFGPATRPWVPSRSGVAVVGVRIGLAHGRSVAGAPLERWRNQWCPLTEVWGPAATTEAERQLTGMDDEGAAVGLLAHTVTARAAQRPAAARTLRLVEHLEADRTVQQIAEELGVSVRQIHRQCVADLGLAPVLVRRILRLHRAAALWRPASDTSFADLAAKANYSDQPHLVRDFHALAGQTPSTALG